MTKVKCVDNKNNWWLTSGKTYDVVDGEIDDGFEIVDDEGEEIFQFRLNGLHGLFERVTE